MLSCAAFAIAAPFAVRSEDGRTCSQTSFSVGFAVGSDDLTPAARAELAANFKDLRGCRVVRVMVSGFGDPMQPSQESEMLGARRSEAVSRALATVGLPRALMTTRSGASSLAGRERLGSRARVIVYLSGRAS